MTEAVIVSTARTPLCKSWRGALNMTHGATMGGHVVKARARARQARAGRGLRRHHGLRQPRGRDRRQYRAPDRAARRPAGHGLGHDREPLLLVGPADRRARQPAHHAGRGRHHDRRRRRVDLVRAERSEQAHDPGRLADQAQARGLLADAADRGDGRQALQDPARGAGPLRRREPAQGRQVARRGQVQGRDRPDQHQDEGDRQEDQRRDAQGRHRYPRTRASARTRPTRACRRSSPRSRAA